MSRYRGRRAKIVATVGPATDSREALHKLIAAGVDVFRLNFSHGSAESHGRIVEELQRLRRDTGANFAILQDLPGPKVRVGGLVKGGPIDLIEGESLGLTADPVEGNKRRIAISYQYLVDDVGEGQRVLLDDGAIELEVTGKRDRDLITKIIRGGRLSERKGVNFPGIELRGPAMTAEDETALHFGLQHEIDLVAVSFVRSPQDAEGPRRVMREVGRSLPLIAKIEKPQALDRLEGIFARFDGVMVARGDLGVEVAPELVPVWQKRIINRGNDLAKPVITATQMLESMVHSPRPTRAEASDVANAILDGTDAVMLSAETSIGDFPIESVRTMERIILATEESAPPAKPHGPVAQTDVHAVAHAACELAREFGAQAIAVVTRSGQTARLVSAERPAVPIVAFTDNDLVHRQLPLWWGVRAEHLDLVGSVEALAPEIEHALKAMEMVPEGGSFVLVGATPLAAGARTNFVKLHLVGDQPSEPSNVAGST